MIVPQLLAAIINVLSCVLAVWRVLQVRTSQNFTYDQGSHVMQYGDLDIDRELAGDYEGMMHNGTKPSPTIPTQDWIDHAAAVRQQQQQKGGVFAANYGGSDGPLQKYSSPAAFIERLKAKSNKASGLNPADPANSNKLKKPKHQHQSVEQRDADLVPLAAAAHSAPCPRRRAAAAAALQKATAARLSLEAAARSALARLLREPGVGYVMMTNLGWNPTQVLLQGSVGSAGSDQQQQQRLAEPSLLLGDVVEGYVEALMGPLPQKAGEPVVGDWECLRGMVQVRIDCNIGSDKRWSRGHAALCMMLCKLLLKLCAHEVTMLVSQLSYVVRLSVRISAQTVPWSVGCCLVCTPHCCPAAVCCCHLCRLGRFSVGSWISME